MNGLRGRDAFAGMLADGMPRPLSVISALPFGQQRDGEPVGMAGQGFIDRIGRRLRRSWCSRTVIGVNRYNARGDLRNRFQALQDLDAVSAIFGGIHHDFLQAILGILSIRQIFSP